MIPIAKLAKLSPNHRSRKIAQILHGLERTAREGGAWDERYAGNLIGIVISETSLPAPLRERASAAMESGGVSADSINLVRNDLLQALGLEPADWDFLARGSANLDAGARKPFPGMRVFLDDVRSPFNVGSILRSAEAFGVEEVLVSPFTADPNHPRAQRTAMGADSVLPWRRALPGDLPAIGTPFALELGGTPLSEFDFPPNGIAIFGSEELGVSPEALSVCESRVSIPMRGAKASINVGVAAGILLNAWAESLADRD